MDREKLKQGNVLINKIEDFQAALNCFEWKPNHEDATEVNTISLNPSLIIEFDDCDDGRDQIKLPMVLSDFFVKMLKDTIKEKIVELGKEFEEL